MKKMVFLNNLNKYFHSSKVLAIIGFFFLIIFLWNRFLRERLPKNIPMQLSFFSLLILLLICCLYLYAIYKILKGPRPDNIIKYSALLLTPLYQPLYALNNFMLNNEYTKKFLRFLIRQQLYFVLNNKIKVYRQVYIYFFFFIISKIVFLLCLCLDCFYFKQLNLIYPCMIITSFPLYSRYLLYCMQIFIKENITLLEKDFLIEITSKDEDDDEPDENIDKYDPNKLFFLYSPSDLNYDDYDDDFSGFPNMIRYKYLKIRKFIEYQSDALYFLNRLYEYKILFNNERKDYIILIDKTPNITLSKEKCEDILSITINMTWFHKIVIASQKYNLINYTQIIILFLFFICWFYILIISLHTTNWLDIVEIFLGTLSCENNPFNS